MPRHPIKNCKKHIRINFGLSAMTGALHVLSLHLLCSELIILSQKHVLPLKVLFFKNALIVCFSWPWDHNDREKFGGNAKHHFVKNKLPSVINTIKISLAGTHWTWLPRHTSKISFHGLQL